jgi:outer membrane protein OmpA-like peptidoglycan-associated protein
MAVTSLLLMGVALAQDSGDIELPDLNSQLWRPAVDATHTLWTLDTGQAPERWTSGRLYSGYLMDPLVVVYDDGQRVDLVSDVVQLDLAGAVQLGRMRLALDLPLYLLSRGDLGDGGGGSGDLMIDVKGTLHDRDGAPVGFALDGRLLLPTASVDLPLGNPGLGWELAMVADKQLGPVLLAANLGTRGLPRVDLTNATVDDQLFFRLGGGWALTERAGVSADLAGAFTYANPIAEGAGAPLELLLGGWGRATERLVVRGGLGTGLTPGIGSPHLRALLSVGYEPSRDLDPDRDGLRGAADTCPSDPEDFDGWHDDDGCPDPSVALQVRLLGADRVVLPAATGTLEGDAQSAQGAGDFTVQVHPGPHRLAATAPGYRAKEVSVEVSDPGPNLVEVTLDPLLGALRLSVLGPEDQPIAADVVVDATPPRQAAGGSLELALPPGSHQVTVQAAGFVAAHLEASVVADQTAQLVVHLKAAQAQVTHEKIEIRGEVYFDTGKDTIKPESFGLLDEVAAILAEHPEIQRICIEGHTDERGKANINQDLSDRRAAAVRTYLTGKGIAPDRLRSVGYGESRPVAPGHDEAAWNQNRRVEFMIEAWADGG